MFVDDRLTDWSAQDAVTDFLDELIPVPSNTLNVLEMLRTRRRSNVIINVGGFYDALICAIPSLFLPLVSTRRH